MTPGPQTPCVSVVMPCHGAVPIVAVQLEALARQVSPPPFEVLICDNRENDGLDEIVSGLHRRHPGFDVRIIDATAEAGTAFARNCGIRAASGDKLLFCDADDVVGEDWVRLGAAALERFEAFSGGAIPFSAKDLEQELDDVRAEIARRLPRYAAEDGHMVAGTYPILLGCSFGMRREFAARIGGFDARFRSQAEDNELAFRIQDALGMVPRVPDVVIAYRLRPRGEMTYARAFRSGYSHAALCARHEAWAVSPSFQGHWILRPLREGLSGALASTPKLFPVVRLAGLALGRARFTVRRPRT